MQSDLELLRSVGHCVPQGTWPIAHTGDIPVAALIVSEDEQERPGSRRLGLAVDLSTASDLDTAGDILGGWPRPCDHGARSDRLPASRVLQVVLHQGSGGQAGEVARHLRSAGFAASCRCIHGNRALLGALDEQDWDVVVVGFTEDASALQEAVDLVRSRLTDAPIVLLADRHEADAASVWIARGVSEVVGPSNTDRLLHVIRRGEPSPAPAGDSAMPASPTSEASTVDGSVSSPWTTPREARLAIALEDAGLAYWEQDIVTGIELCSASAAEMLDGGGRADRDRRLLEATHPEDAGNLRRTMDGVLVDGTAADVLFRVAASGGGWRWLLLSMQVQRDVGGNAVALFGVLRPRDDVAGVASGGRVTSDASTWTVDWDRLAMRGPGGPPWVDRLAASIARSYQGTALRLRAVAEAGDDDNMALLAHSVKAMASQLDLPALRDLAVEAEHAAKARSPGASARARRLADAMDRVLANVVRHVDRRGPLRLLPDPD